MEKGQLVVSHCGGSVGDRKDDPDEMDEEIFSAMTGSKPDYKPKPTVNEGGMISAMLSHSVPKGRRVVTNEGQEDRAMISAMLSVEDGVNEEARVSPLLELGNSVDIFAAVSYIDLNGLAKTFTISYPGNEMSVQVGLNATRCNLTFPTGSVCSFDGHRSPNNVVDIFGNLGDVYIAKITKRNSGYTVAITNIGQWESQDSDFKRLLA